MKYTIGAYLFNDLYEKLVGRRPALDFLGIANEAVGDYTGYQLPNTVDAAQQLISGEGVDFTTQRKGAVQATASLAENVAQELPFVGGVLGGGRVPMLDADKNGSVSTDELYAAMDSQGLDAGQQAALWYAYAGSGQRMKYEKAEEYGLGRIYAEMLRYADTNNSGTLNKDELRAYLDSTGLNRAQKAVLFELASTAKNPYE